MSAVLSSFECGSPARSLASDFGSIAFSFGDITLGLTPGPGMHLQAPPEMRPFAAPPAACDVELQVRQIPSLELPPQDCDFDSGSLWRLYRIGGELHFYFSSSAFGPRPYKLLRVDPLITAGEILMSAECAGRGAAEYPLEYPADELLIVHKLGSAGIELHGCGVVRGGEGDLFVGHSGAGKSTLARLWAASRPGVRISSDDRIILRASEVGVRMYGTPWHGEAGFAAAESAPLRRIFILRHGSENRLQRLAPRAAAAELFARSFVPLHSHQPVQAALAFLEELVNKVDCYRFSFLPHESAVERILDFDENRAKA